MSSSTHRKVPGPRLGPTKAQRSQALALREFDRLAEQLRRSGVTVIVVEDTRGAGKAGRDLSQQLGELSRDGTVVLYPMLAPTAASSAART